MSKKVKRIIAEEVVYDGAEYCDLGHYNLLFKEACMIMAKCKLSRAESSLLLYVLGSMRSDGQVYIHVPEVAKYVDYSRATVYNALASLATRQLLLRIGEDVRCGSKLYQIDLTHQVNQRIAFQGKLTTDRARLINNQMPRLLVTNLLGKNVVDAETGELLGEVDEQCGVLDSPKKNGKKR